MLRYALLLSFAVVCFAQTPPRPDIPETFSSSGILEVHRSKTVEVSGSFILDRDEDKDMDVENGTFKEENGTVHYEVLELFNKSGGAGVRYTIRQIDNEQPHCQIEPLSGNVQQFWGWVKVATYVGKKEYHEIEYDVWQYTTGGIELTLFVPDGNPNTPVLFIRKAGVDEYIFIFKSFSGDEPPAVDFVVPRACQSQMNQSPPYRSKPYF